MKADRGPNTPPPFRQIDFKKRGGFTVIIIVVVEIGV